MRQTATGPARADRISIFKAVWVMLRKQPRGYYEWMSQTNGGAENGVDNPWRATNEGLVAIFQWLSIKPIISRFLVRRLRLSLGYFIGFFLA
jgi:hypothetical protein